MVTKHSASPMAGSRSGAGLGQIVLVAKPGGPQTGVGRYVQALEHQLREAGLPPARLAPSLPPLPQAGYAWLRRRGVDLGAFLTNYPVWASYPRADIYHLTSQNLASLLLFRRPPGRVVVTVHDIIPYLLRRHPRLSPYRTAADRLFDWLAMMGLRRADALIADSQYTRQCLVEQLGLPTGRVAVAHLGIDQAHFRPLAVPESCWERYQLPRHRRYLIYVGSEDPRKNLETLLRALGEVRRKLPDVALIKVGRAHHDAERRRLMALAASVGAAVHFLDEVPEDDLPLLYNLAELCVMPSLYEGFGFPLLEAMACGTPVVCARATSLPEIAGDAALLFDQGPGAEQALAERVLRLLTDTQLAGRLAALGVAQAAAFRWQRTCQQVLEVYQSVLAFQGREE